MQRPAHGSKKYTIVNFGGDDKTVEHRRNVFYRSEFSIEKLLGRIQSKRLSSVELGQNAFPRSNIVKTSMRD